MDDENDDDDDDETKKIKLSEKRFDPFSHRTRAVKHSDLPLYQLAHFTYSIR
jgi:hypothetical protein